MMITRTLLIHKADNSRGRIFNDPQDVSINITASSGEPAYKSEGIGLADALWDALPAMTIDAMMNRLTQLSDASLAESFRLGLGIDKARDASS